MTSVPIRHLQSKDKFYQIFIQNSSPPNSYPVKSHRLPCLTLQHLPHPPTQTNNTLHVAFQNVICQLSPTHVFSGLYSSSPVRAYSSILPQTSTPKSSQ
jgi:hypothetical protein